MFSGADGSTNLSSACGRQSVVNKWQSRQVNMMHWSYWAAKLRSRPCMMRSNRLHAECSRACGPKALWRLNRHFACRATYRSNLTISFPWSIRIRIRCPGSVFNKGTPIRLGPSPVLIFDAYPSAIGRIKGTLMSICISLMWHHRLPLRYAPN